MVKFFFLLSLIVFVHATTSAQVYHFTSDLERKVKFYSPDLQSEKKEVFVDLDLKIKKITIAKETTRVYNIVSVDTKKNQQRGRLNVYLSLQRQ